MSHELLKSKLQPSRKNKPSVWCPMCGVHLKTASYVEGVWLMLRFVFWNKWVKKVQLYEQSSHHYFLW